MKIWFVAASLISRWNRLPDSVDFTSLLCFNRSLEFIPLIFVYPVKQLLICFVFCLCMCASVWAVVSATGLSVLRGTLSCCFIFTACALWNKKAVLSQRWPRDARYISRSWGVAEIWPYEIIQDGGAILNLFESKIAPLDPPSPKTPA